MERHDQYQPLSRKDLPWTTPLVPMIPQHLTDPKPSWSSSLARYNIQGSKIRDHRMWVGGHQWPRRTSVKVIDSIEIHVNLKRGKAVIGKVFRGDMAAE